MLFALLVLNSAVPHHELVFETASFVILASIVAHGLTDTVGSALDRAPHAGQATGLRRVVGLEPEGVGAALVPEDE